MLSFLKNGILLRKLYHLSAEEASGILKQKSCFMTRVKTRCAVFMLYIMQTK